MTKRINWIVAERVESIARTVLILIAGPGWEAMVLSGALDFIASSLAAAMLRLGETCSAISTLQCEAASTCLTSRSGTFSHVRTLRLILAPAAFAGLSFKHRTVAFPQSQNNFEAGR